MYHIRKDLIFALFVRVPPRIEVVQWFEAHVLVHENVALEPVWKGLGDLILGVRTGRDCD